MHSTDYGRDGNVFYDGFAGWIRDVEAAGCQAACTAILACIDTLTAGEGTALKVHLDRWITLGTKAFHMDAGAVGPLTGMTVNYGEERAEIRRQVIIIVPFYRAQDDYRRAFSLSARMIR
jgi:hypothetical protein